MSSTPPSPSFTTPQFTPRGLVPTAEQLAIQTGRPRHIIVMANAGAAKTTTLALRIAESLTRGVWPSSILALSFSAEAARVLMERLQEIGVEAKLAQRVHCTTFDAFAREVLAEAEGSAPPFLATPDALAPRVCAAVAAVKAQNQQRRRPRELWWPEHNEQIFDFLAQVRRLKAALRRPDGEEGEDAEAAAEALDVPLSVFLLFCQLEKERAGWGDVPAWRGEFDATYDLACRLADGSGEALLPAYRIVVVDELQDMNPASYALLEGVLARGKAFFTGAGDFDQVIHRWAGADVNFLRTRFGAGWSSVARLPLTKTYRHGPVMALATAALKGKEVVSGRAHETRMVVERYAERRAGAERLAACVADWKARGGALDDCAIILRSPDQSIAIENALLEAGLGWRVEGLTSYLLRPEILMLRGVIAFALNDYESIPGVDKRLQVLRALLMWQQFEWGAERLEDSALKTAAEQPELFDAFLQGTLLRPQTRAARHAAQLSGEDEAEAEHRFLAKLAELRRAGRHDEANTLANLRRADAETVDETPTQRGARLRLQAALAMLRAAPAEAPAGALLARAVELLALPAVARQIYIEPASARMVERSIAGFIAAAERQALSLRDFAAWLRTAETRAARLRAKHTVLLCTVEAAKGQEFAAVLLPFLEADAFPLAGADPAEESNRFYVALTRARDEVTLFVPDAAARVSPYVAALQLDKAITRGRLQVEAWRP